MLAPMTVQQERALASLSPMWQRIAEGQVNLDQYTDEEILSGEICMADGRKLPAPPVLPEPFIREQVRRGFKVAQRQIREGAMDALGVYSDILNDRFAEDKDRIAAGKFFLERFLGKEAQHVHVHTDPDEARQELIRRLVAARQGLPVAAALAVASGEQLEGDMYEAELVDDATIHLEELL